MIRIYCEAADAVLKETQTLTAGMINYPEVLLTFSDAWDGFGKAVIVKAGEVEESALLVNNKFIVPSECLAESGVNLIVGVSGSDGVETIPTIWCSCGMIMDSVDVNDSTATGTATPSLVEQMIAYAGQIEAYAEDLDENVIRVVDVNDTGANAYGTATVTITDTGASDNRTVTFTFANLKGNGISSINFVTTGANKGRVQITELNGTVTDYDGIKEAIAAIEAAEADVATAETLRATAEALRVTAEEARVEAEAGRASEWSDWGDIVRDAEAYATGTRGGVPVGPGDPAYENNATYMRDAAAQYTLQADSFSGESAAWATGSYDGGAIPVPSTEPQYNNNAKYWAGLAEQSAAQAGYMDLHIDADGHLILTRTDNVDSDFYIDSNGHLIWTVGEDEE